MFYYQRRKVILRGWENDDLDISTPLIYLFNYKMIILKEENVFQALKKKEKI
jgi:hypothetical protein